MPRRRSSVVKQRHSAADVASVPKSVELEQRVARLELAQRDVIEKVDRLLNRTAAIQAQLDHLAARIGR